MAPWSECDIPVKVVRESWRVPRMEWLLEPQMMADGIYVSRAVLSRGGGEVAVHAINKTPSTFTVDIGREVGHANMAQMCRAVLWWN